MRMGLVNYILRELNLIAPTLKQYDEQSQS